MWHICQVLTFDLIEGKFIICLFLKGTVPKHWTSLGKLVKFVGQPAFDAVHGMEKRSLMLALGVFKDCEVRCLIGCVVLCCTCLATRV